MMFPFLLLLCDYFVNKKVTQRDVFDKGPYFLIAAFFGILALVGQHASGAIGYNHIFTFLRNIGLASAVILFYLAKALVPLNLSCFYTYPRMFPVSYLILCFIAVICLWGAIRYSLRFTRKLFFGFVFFLISLFPVLQFVPIGQTVVADRYTYISLIGIFYVIVETFHWLYRKGFPVAFAKKFVILLLMILTGILSFLSWSRCRVWADSATLWNDAVRKSSGQIIPLNNRGEAYYERGDFDRALTDYNHIVKINPFLAKTYYNRGNVFRAQGRFPEAIAEYTRAIALDTQSFDCYNERGMTYQLQGDFSKALSDYNEALRLNPHYFLAYINRGILFRKQGKFDLAIADYGEAIRLEPFLGLAYQNRAVAYAGLQEYSKAWADIQQALRLGARVPEEFIEDVRKGAGYD
ncbi:MAG: tetratricopeptide repeat protein [Candidatus Omnitrophota bacterium]